MFAPLAILVLIFAAGMIALVIFAIIRKKWALLFIPLGIVMVIALFVSLNFVSVRRVQSAKLASYQNRLQTVKHAKQASSQAHGHLEARVTEANPAQITEYEPDSNVTRNQPYSPTPVAPPKVAVGGIILIVPLLFVILITIAIIRKKWALLYIPLGLVLILLAIRFVRVGTPMMSDDINVTASVQPAREFPQAYEPDPIPAVWSPGIEDEFRTNNFYSLSSALEEIAIRAQRGYRINRVVPEPQKIAVVTYRDEFDEETISKALSSFRKHLPESEFIPVTAGIDSLDGYEDKINMRLKLTDRSGKTVMPGTRVTWSYENSISGRISIHMLGTSYRSSDNVSFQQKPWLEDFAAFCNQRPQNHYRIAYSQNPAASFQSAQAQAETQATQIVAQRVFQAAQSIPGSNRRKNNDFTISQRDIYSYQINWDSFSQSLSGNVDIYRHAILLNLSPQRINRLTQAKLGIQQAARRSWAQMIASAIGVALVICIIYLILNAATKGYYTAVLRILAAAGIIGVIVLLMMMIA